MPIVLDANNLILGRFASEIAKILLDKISEVTGVDSKGKTVTLPTEKNNKVFVVNAEKAVITGNPNTTTKRYLQRMHIKTLTNPRRGPFHPRQPEVIVKRAVRGMLPWKKATGKEAYKRLKIYVGTPEGLSGDVIRLSKYSADNMTSQRITVGEVARRISTYEKRL